MLEEFESFLLKHLPKSDCPFHQVYDEALHYMLKAGGKRFRPMLLLSVVKAYNPLLLQNAYYAALAIELIHTYSLIHDDLPAMDNADLRRGNLTIHKKYDEHTAILVGDALNTYAFEVLAEAPFSDTTRIQLIYELARNGGLGGMVLGQSIDCSYENIQLSLEQLEYLHTNKTAKLIAASLKMGALIVDEQDEAQKLYDIGLKLGLLFQIQDDILDVTQTSDEAGKTTNNDEDKNSFVKLMGLEKARKEADDLSQEIVTELATMQLVLQKELEPLLVKYLDRHRIKQ